MNTSRFYCAALFAFILALLFACSNAYIKTKPVTPASAYPVAIEKAKKDHRYMIMQSGINLYAITSVDLDRQKQAMTVTLDKVDSSRLIDAVNLGNKRYKPQKGEPPVSSQIHLYMADSTSYTLDEPHTIPMNKVGRIELID